MYTLKIENEHGEIFELTHSRDYTVTHISGLMPPKNGINLSTAGLIDGAEFNSSHADVRNIVITLYLEGDVEANRQKLYRIFPYKSPCTVYFKNKHRNVKIQGYLELLDSDPFVKREAVQISLICPRPYWVGLDEIRAELSRSIAGFEFPFSIPSVGVVISGSCPYPVAVIRNPGDTAVGFTAQISVADAEPELTLTEIVAMEPNSIMKHRVLIPLDPSEYDPETQLLDITVNGTVKDPAAYTTDFITYADSSRDLRVNFQSAILQAGNVVQAFIYTWQTVQIPQETDYATTNLTTLKISGVTYDVPEWYDTASGIEITLCTAEETGDVPISSDKWAYADIGNGKLHFTVTDSSYYTTYRIRPVITGTTEEQQKTGTNYPARPEAVSAPAELFLTPFAHTANDLIRVYMGGKKLTGWSMETVDISDGSQEICLHIGKAMTAEITVQLIQSIDPETDISEYTDIQVEEGLKHVSDLILFNESTNEKMELSGMAFRPNDVIEISTISGNIYVKCVSSDWLTPGENLMPALSPDSDFPKLRQGENRVHLTAVTCQELLSASLTAQKLYGGV